MAMAVVGTRTEVLRILIEAKNLASKELAAAGAEADAMGGRVGAMGKAVRAGLMGLGIAAAGFLAVSVGEAAKYQTMLQHVQANTGMTDKAMQAMSKGILAMSAQTGAPLEQLSEGFMHIANFGFSAADAMKILKPAMESALSTGDDVGKVATVLAGVLHEFGMQASKAGVAMNTIHLAAQMGNSTLGAFADGTARAYNVAATLGVSLVDVSAGLSTLTRANQTARVASDGMTSAMFGIIKPTTLATSMLSYMDHTLGTNLVQQFTVSGLKAYGFANILGNVHAAAVKLANDPATKATFLRQYADELTRAGVSGDKFNTKMAAMGRALNDPNQIINAIFRNVRAAREVMLLTGTQADDFKKHLTAMSDAMSGKVDPTTAAFNREQKTMAAQLKIAEANLRVMSIVIGTELLPVLTKMLQQMLPVIRTMAEWIAKHPQLTVAILATATALGAVAAIMPGVIVLLGAARIAVIAMTGPVGILAVGLIALVTHLDDVGNALDSASNKMNTWLHLGTQGHKMSVKEDIAFVAQYQHSGDAMMQGMAQGMYDKMSAVDKAAVDAAERAINATNSALQSKSPSRVFHVIGADISQGLIDGIGSMHGAVTKAAHDSADIYVQAYVSRKGKLIAGHWADAPGDAARERAGLSPLGVAAGTKAGHDAADVYVKAYISRSGKLIAAHWADAPGDAAREAAGLAPLGRAGAAKGAVDAMDYWVKPHLSHLGKLIAGHWADRAGDAKREAAGLAPLGLGGGAGAAGGIGAGGQTPAQIAHDLEMAHYYQRRAAIDHGQRARNDLQRAQRYFALAGVQGNAALNAYNKRMGIVTDAGLSMAGAGGYSATTGYGGGGYAAGGAGSGGTTYNVQITIARDAITIDGAGADSHTTHNFAEHLKDAIRTVTQSQLRSAIGAPVGIGGVR